ncbi:MAG: glycosyltransferase family 39 protein [Bdellovibrionota bacterium]
MQDQLSSKKDILLLALILIVAFFLRFDFLVASNIAIDADEAIVGLMAKHALEGIEMPTFYYGQHYMGSFEPWLVSLVFKIFGVSAIALKSVPLLVSLLVVLAVFALGKEIGGSKVGLLAALFAAVPPSTFLIWSTKARGGFIELLLIGSLSLIFAIRWLKSASPSLIFTTLIGVILGFGWWVNNQIIYFIAPIGLMFVYHSLTGLKGSKFKNLFEHFLSGLLGFFAGGINFWIYNIQNDFVSFEMFGASSPTDILEHFSGLFSTALPILIGAKRFWHTDDVFSGASIIAYLLYAIVLLYPFIFRNQLCKKGLYLIGFFLDAVFIIFCLSSFGWLVEAPRYLLPAYIGLFTLSAASLFSMAEYSKKLAIVLCVTILSLNLASCYLGGRTIPGEPYVFKAQRVARDHSELIAWLNEHQIKYLRTNYWIGYRLAFETKEEIKFIVFQEPNQTRINSYLQEVKAKQVKLDQLPLVLVPEQAKMVSRALKLLGYTFKKAKASGYQILYDINQTTVLNEIPKNYSVSTQASHGTETSKFALDDKLNTRWATASHQEQGMWYRVIFDQPQTISRISFLLGDWKHDYPRGLAVFAELENRTETRLLSPREYWYLRYYTDLNSRFDFYFTPVKVRSIKFVQTDQHPILDWSIAELEFYN